MTPQALQIIHRYIARYILLRGVHPTAEHLARVFNKSVPQMRVALLSYAEAKS